MVTSRLAVVDTALAVIDAQGPDALTLAAVAQRLGIATPSLYKHVDGLSELRAQVGERVLTELTEVLSESILGRSGDEAVAALLRAVRTYVHTHPHRYAALPRDPLHDPALTAVGERLLRVFLAVLHDYGLSDSDAVHATRCLRTVAHGFATIEVGGGFGLPEDLDETYERLIAMVLASLPHR